MALEIASKCMVHNWHELRAVIKGILGIPLRILHCEHIKNDDHALQRMPGFHEPLFL